jgi:hypothetical protein
MPNATVCTHNPAVLTHRQLAIPDGWAKTKEVFT